MSNLYLAHYGIKGQVWGKRRYQNKDGSLTPEGVQRYRRKFKKDFDLAEKTYYSSEKGDLSGWTNAVGKLKKSGLSDRAVGDVVGPYLGESLGTVLKSAKASNRSSSSLRKERVKEVANKLGRSAVSSAAGGAAAGAVTLAFAAAAPGALPSTALVAFGKTVATSVASNVGFTLANEAINSPEFKNGKKKVYSMLKGG